MKKKAKKKVARKRARILFECSLDFRRHLRRAAKRRETSMSEYIRQAIAEKADSEQYRW